MATALADLPAGESLDLPGGRTVLRQDIPFGHKFALRDIGAGQPVVKYGETIGLATVAIAAGQHVHVHNVESVRGRGDRGGDGGRAEART